jgi:hypothetical protein
MALLAVMLLGGVPPGASCWWFDDDGSGDEYYSPCGNGRLEPEYHEQCDDGAHNSSEEPDACRHDCTLPRCGDWTRDSDEECDNRDFGGETCVDFGWSGGLFGCDDSCRATFSDCALCGDGRADGYPFGQYYEACDGPDLRGLDCAALGRGEGTLRCSVTCRLDVSGCDDPEPDCGNGVLEVGEACDDGSPLGPVGAEAHSGDGCDPGCNREEAEWEIVPWDPYNQSGYIERIVFADAWNAVVGYSALGSSGRSSTMIFRDGQWTEIEYAGGKFTSGGTVMAWDAHRERVVLYGGYRDFDDAFYTQPTDETWEFDGENWTLRDDLGVRPPARMEAAMVYDSARKQMVLFGGRLDYDYGPILGNDTWAYDGTAWWPVPSDTAPSARQHHAMAYDARRDRVVLFGGDTETSGRLDETWEFAGDSWLSPAPPRNPPGRSGAYMTFHAGRGRVLLWGGETHDPGRWGRPGDLWEWDGMEWWPVPTETAPQLERGGALVYDSNQRIALLVGLWSTRNDVVGELPWTYHEIAILRWR